MNSAREIIELELWESLRNGDESALRQLYMNYYKHLLTFGLRYSEDRDTLKDSLNNTFLYIWEKHSTLGAAKHVGNYLFKSFQRQLERDLKKTKALEELMHTSIEKNFHESDETQFITKQEEDIRVKLLKDAILKLSARQRELITLRYYDGLSYDEIAANTQLSKRAVYNQIHTAVNKLKQDPKLHNLKGFLSLLLLF